MVVRHDTCWFDPKWLGRIVHFENPPSSWKIVQRLHETETRSSQDDYVSSGYWSEATCVFVCEATRDSTQAIMKIRMQIPNSPEDKPCYPIFSQPAERDICVRTSQEIWALEALTVAGCSSTPKYIASKHENQPSDSWVSGGFLDYIVMEKLEGVPLSVEYLRTLSPTEQENIRKAFKEAYQECEKHGFYNVGHDLPKLIWNEEKMQCYIVGWSLSVRKAYPWRDSDFSLWGLLPF